MKNFLRKNKLYAVGALIGAAGGFLYARYIGCSSGRCMITSSPLISTIYFSVIGILLVSFFQPSTKVPPSDDLPG